MNSGQRRRLLAAYRYAQSRPLKVIVLGGPRDFFSNGIHLPRRNQAPQMVRLAAS